MTLAQRRALAPLLTKIGESRRLFPSLYRDVEADHCSPGMNLTSREWLKILEEFGTE